MLIMTTYVDNLERGAYDIPFIVKNWEADLKVVFGGSPTTCGILENQFKGRDDVRVVNIGIPIKYPHDIPVAFNACVEKCYEFGADAVIHTHADVYLTKYGMGKFLEYYQQHLTYGTCYDHIQLYARLWTAHPSVILSHKDYRVYWNLTDDGSTLDNVKTQGTGTRCCDDMDIVLDNGYFSVKHYQAKMRNHNHIWPDEYKSRVLHDFSLDVREGLSTAYMAMRKALGGGSKLNPIDCNRYKDLLDEYVLWEEFDMCMKVMEQVNRKYVA